jgi:hypothetical protein
MKHEGTKSTKTHEGLGKMLPPRAGELDRRVTARSAELAPDASCVFVAFVPSCFTRSDEIARFSRSEQDFRRAA